MRVIGAAEAGGAITGMAVSPALLEGRLPEPQEFMDAAIMVGGLKAATGAASKLRSLYGKTGVTPAEVVAEAKNDPQIVDDLTGVPKVTPEITKWIETSKTVIDGTNVTNSTELVQRIKDTLGPDHFATVLLEKLDSRLKGYKVEVLSDSEWKYQGFSEFQQARSDPKKMTLYFRENIKAEGAVHEVVHEATQAELMVNPAFQADIKGIMDRVRGEIEAGNVEGVSKAELGRMKKAMKNEAEFVAYGLTSPEVMNVLRGIRGDGPRPTLFTQFVSTLARAFGFGERDYTALHDLIRAVEKGADESKPFEGGTVKDYVKGAKKEAAQVAAGGKTAGEQLMEQMSSDPNPPTVKPHIKLKSTPDQISIPRAYEKMASETVAADIVPGEKAQQVLDQPFADIPETKLPHQINLKYVDGPESLKAGMTRLAEVYTDEINQQRGGKQGWAETEQKAQQLLTDNLGSEEAQKILTGRQPGTAANAVELKVRGDMLMKAASDMAAAIKAVKDAGVNATDAMKADALAAIHKAAMIQAEFTGAAAETARALQYLQRIKQVREGTEPLKNMVDMYGKDPDTLLSLALAMDHPAKMLKFAKEASKATTWDKIVEGWKAGLVSGPITQIANMAGSLSFMAVRPVVDAVAVLMPTLGKAERVTAMEPVARIWGNIAGTLDGLRLAKAALFDDGMGGKAEHKQAIEGRTGYYIRTPFRLLGAGDALFREMASRGEAYAEATRLAAKEGFNPSTAEFQKRVVELAQSTEVMEFAARMTFNAKLGELGRATNNFVRKWHMEWAVPFISTPGNVFKEMARLTPAAPIIGEWRADIAKGGPAAQKAMAEVTVGFGLSALAFSWGLGGQISGNGDPDPNKRNTQLASGWQPYSVKIGDKWYSYQRLQPVGTLMGMAADMAEAWEHLTPEESDKVSKILATAFANAVTKQTFMQGLANVADAMSAPDRNGPRFVQSLAASTVPGAIGQTAQLLDPYQREIQSIADAVRNRIPLAREGLMPKRDLFGQEVANTDRVAGISPIARSTESTDKVRTEAARLKVGAEAAPKSVQVPSAHDRQLGKVELTPEQRDIFGSAAGKATYDAMQPVVNSPAWDLIPDMIKKRYFEVALERGRKVGSAMAVTPEQRQQEANRVIEEVKRRLAQ
jgi:hypothetical protein